MRVRSAPIAMTACAAVFVCAGLLMPARVEGTGSCKVGDAYLAAGFPDLAQKEFEARKAVSCGQDGLDRVHGERIRRADVVVGELAQGGISERIQQRVRRVVIVEAENEVVAHVRRLFSGTGLFTLAIALKEADMVDAAAEAIVVAIKANPGAPIPEALATLPRAQATSRIKRAERLDEIGLHDAAEKQVEQAIEIDPGVPIPARLQQEDREPAGWASFKSNVVPWAITGAQIGIALLALWVALMALRFKFNIGAFDAGDEKTLASGLPDALQEHIVRITYDSAGANPKLASPADAETDKISTSLTTVVPQAAISVALFSLARRLALRTWILSGTVREFNEHDGAGLSLAIKNRRGRVVDRVTVWQRQFMPGGAPKEEEKQNAYHELTGPGAAWTVFTRGQKRHADFEIFGSTDWRSFALFASGVAAEQRGDKAEARALYWMALDQDPGNDGARLNLADEYITGPELWTSDPDGRRDQMLGWLTEIRQRRSVEDQDQDQSDLLWYKVAYLEAVGHFWKADRLFDGPTADPDAKAREVAAGLSVAIDLCRRMEKRLTKRRLVWGRSRDRKVRRFLAEMEASNLALLASFLLIEDKPCVQPRCIRNRQDLAWKLATNPSWISPRSLIDFAKDPPSGPRGYNDVEGRKPGARGYYDIACYYSSLGDLRTDPVVKNNAYKEALTALRAAVDRHPRWRIDARNDRDLRGVRENLSKEFKCVVEDKDPKETDSTSDGYDEIVYEALFGHDDRHHRQAPP